MSATEETLALLRSIDASLKLLVKQQVQAPANTVASDRDLDSKYGDETIKVNPRDWTGPSFKGRRMSECPAEFLDIVADTYAYFAKKNDAAGAVTDKGKPKSEFDRRSESRARGWAKRIRDGRHTVPHTDGPGDAAEFASAEDEPVSASDVRW